MNITETKDEIIEGVGVRSEIETRENGGNA
jgi:hypothetical protein